jgi:pilus assembly protein TadC
VTFCIILMGCIDGLDSCFAGEEGNPEMRLRVIRVFFAIYRFYTDSLMDLDEDIPGLLVGNTTPEERQIIAGWLRDALSQTKAEESAGYRQRYAAFLAALEQIDRP